MSRQIGMDCIGCRPTLRPAHRLLCRLGHARVAVEGGDGLQGALATVDGGARVLVWLYPVST